MTNTLDFNNEGGAVIEIPQIGNDYSLVLNHWYLFEYQLQEIENDLQQSDSEQRTSFLKKYANELQNFKEQFQEFDSDEEEYEEEYESEEEREFYETESNKNLVSNYAHLEVSNFELKHSLAWYLMNFIDEEIKKIEIEIEKQRKIQICVADSDKVIEVIRKSENLFFACKNLMEHFDLSQTQAYAIGQMTLRTLTSTSAEDFEELIKFRQTQKSFLEKLK